MKKVFIGTPTIDQKVNTGYMETILALSSLAPEYAFPVFTLGSNSSINDARNQIASIFLTTDCDYLFFLDSDVAIPDVRDVKTLLESNKDIAGIPILRKNAQNPTLNVGEFLEATTEPLVKVKGMATGALLIKREVIEAFKDCETYNIDDAHIINNSNLQKPVFYDMFHSGIIDGHYTHEDYYFCHEAQKRGFDTYAHVKAKSVHFGTIPFFFGGI